MKARAGYTAVEALAALAILGLAMAGLTTSMGLIGLGQAKARARLEQSVRERAADQALERLLALGSPYRSDQGDQLVGDAQAFEIDCGDGRRCAARIEDGELVVEGRTGVETHLRLPDGQNPRFVYVGSYSQGDAWPPAPAPPPAPAWQNLAAVAIQSQAAAQKPLVVVKVWRQQRADCEYDVVIQDCRRTTP